MRLLVGLGNPGAKYAGNRHNVGFMAIDAIAKRHGLTPWRKRFAGQCAEGPLGQERVVLLKPETYMNESGRAVGEAVNFYKLTPEEVIVFHDEIDLAPAKLRIKTGGGNAGHNGLRSITAHIGNDYKRVRIGVGHPGIKEMVQIHVLKDFAKDEWPWVETIADALADSAVQLARGQDSAVQNKVHLALVAKGFAEESEPKPAKTEKPDKAPPSNTPES